MYICMFVYKVSGKKRNPPLKRLCITCYFSLMICSIVLSVCFSINNHTYIHNSVCTYVHIYEIDACIFIAN